MLVCLANAKGAPGASVTALALATTWPADSLLAECDPAGGDLRTGLLTGIGQGRTIANLAMAQRNGAISAQDVSGQLYALHEPVTGHARFALPGLADPMTAAALGGLWDPLAAVAGDARIGPHGHVDVIADCGRLDHPHAPWPLMRAADLVLLAVRSTLPSVMAAAAHLPHLRQALAPQGHGPELAVALVEKGPYSAAEVGSLLEARIALRLPFDATGVAGLNSGQRSRRISRSPLLRAARNGAAEIRRTRGMQRPRSTSGGARREL